MRRPTAAAAAALVLAMSACSGDGHAARRVATRHPASTTTTTTSAPPPSTTAPPTTTTTKAVPTTKSATTRAPSSASNDGFTASVAAIDPATAASMQSSWRPGCPVPLSGLRIVALSYRGFDGGVHTGRLVVNATVTGAIVTVFHRLFDLGFPIERMVPVDAYGGNDDAVDAADDTSAFNCRPPDGGSGWSEHAYGLAVDVNPLRNPYVHADGSVKLAVSRPWTDRSLTLPGMIHAGDAVVRAFASIGWGWGGSWSGARDYQHFSANGH
ncbi:MAG TPA: M15 family metallopeptidase [Acidimicrobiia bacterium]|nr:M15 family metallopeptidase [Acidimicrobiia bacterium]